MKTLIRVTLFAFLLAPLSAHAQERVAVSAEPAPETTRTAEIDWQPIAAWSSVGLLAASIAVIVGTQLRLADIENDARWQDARSSFSLGTENICDANMRPSGGVLSGYLADTCSEAAALETAWGIAIGAGAVSLVSAITFFVLDATEEEERPRISVRASTEGGYVGLSGRF